VSDSINQYVAQRAELLANLVLTRRKDVEVIPLHQKDVGIDLVARVRQPVMGGQVLPMFGVEVKGTVNPLADDEAATRFANARAKRRPSSGLFLFPIAIFLFSVEGDVGYYCWLLEPSVPRDRSPRLDRVSNLSMHKITKRSLDDMVQQVVAWFEAMGDLLSHQSSAEKP